MAPIEIIDLSSEEGDKSEDVVTALRDHFSTVPGWKYETTLQHGAYGVVVRIKRESPRGGGVVQRVAVKRALGRTEEAALRNEIRWLKVWLERPPLISHVLPCSVCSTIWPVLMSRRMEI